MKYGNPEKNSAHQQIEPAKRGCKKMVGKPELDNLEKSFRIMPAAVEANEKKPIGQDQKQI
ncbi:MAG TPA: hypothetical protein VJ508_19065 [Saprospiraceae bacterium]|nr:hypothetical protein [Saprospiraceae bacterium]